MAGCLKLFTVHDTLPPLTHASYLVLGLVRISSIVSTFYFEIALLFAKKYNTIISVVFILKKYFSGKIQKVNIDKLINDLKYWLISHTKL